MQIQVFGTGCPTCGALLELTKTAIKELNLEIEVEYITDIQQMVEMGIMTSPALVINGKIMMTGGTNNIEKVKNLITSEIRS